MSNPSMNKLAEKMAAITGSKGIVNRELEATPAPTSSDVVTDSDISQYLRGESPTPGTPISPLTDAAESVGAEFAMNVDSFGKASAGGRFMHGRKPQSSEMGYI